MPKKPSASATPRKAAAPKKTRAPRKAGPKKPATSAKAKQAAKTTTPLANAIENAELKQQWRLALARLQSARKDEMAGWDDLYEAVGEILLAEPPLFLGGGYRTARAFLAAHLPGVSERSVRGYIRVAKYFDPEDETKYGISKLEQLLDYIEASGGAKLIPAKLSPERQKIRVPNAKGGGHRTVPFVEATFDDLRRAVRSAAAEIPGAKAAKKPKESALVVAIRQALSRASVRGVAVRERSGRIDLGEIAPGQIEDLCRALLAAKLPIGEG